MARTLARCPCCAARGVGGRGSRRRCSARLARQAIRGTASPAGVRNAVRATMRAGRAHGCRPPRESPSAPPGSATCPRSLARRPPRRELRLRRGRRRVRHRPRGPAGLDPRRRRPVRRGQDDDHQADHRRHRPDGGRGARPGRGPAPLPARDARADRLHAPAVHPVSRPHGGRERRLRGQPVRDAHEAPAAARPRGPRARPAVGGARPPRGSALGRHAAPPRARLRARPRAEPAPPRRADRGHRPDPAHRRSGTSSGGSRRRVGRSS